MTMSVGLGRIEVDPRAPVLVRKALGVLSTPHLLVYDTGLSIDDTGRIVIRLKPNGGLIQDENGLSIGSTSSSSITGVGIDSVVELRPDGSGRLWNVSLTGTAPNYMQGSLAIGSKEFSGSSTEAEVQNAKLSVTSKDTHVILRYDEDNYTGIRTLSDGTTELHSVGTSPGFHFVSGDGTYFNNTGGFKINNGVVVEKIVAFRVDNLTISGGGSAGLASSGESVVTYAADDAAEYPLRPGQDIVTVMPLDGVFVPSEILAYTARITDTNEITLRVAWVDVWAGSSWDWLFLVHRLQAV